MKRFILPCLILIILLAASCTENGAGIFYSIEIEEPIANDSLSDNLSSMSVANLSGTYYLAAKLLINVGMNQSISLPDNMYSVSAVASDGAAPLFAVLENTDGDQSALYTFDGTSTWTALTTGVTGRPYDIWILGNGDLYVATVNKATTGGTTYYQYRLYYDDAADASGFTLVNLPSAATYTVNPIVDVDWDGTTVFAINAAACYSGTGSTLTTDSRNGDISSNVHLRKLYYSTGHTDSWNNTLFLSGSNASINGTGSVYEWNGSSWTAISTPGNEDYNDFCDVYFGTNHYLLLGETSGYLEYNGSSFIEESSATVDTDNYDNTDLSGSAVNGLFDIDGTGSTFYAMTSGNGLWVNDGSGSWDLK